MAIVDPGALRVYVVTSAGLVPGRDHLDVAHAAIEGGATAIQLRAPELSDAELAPLAAALAERCRDAGVLFVVNDRVEVAANVGAGAHVGQEDDPRAARERLGAALPLGISVASAEEALAARAAGADYLGVTVWATATKPEAVPRGIHGLRAVVAATDLPVVAIGGVDAANAREVVEAGGASGVAVVSAVGAATDPVAATRELVQAMRVNGSGER
ncbi:MAG TPA: thiamine phosphate synthase [Actinomycetota bacterium]|jgi:thiamine-phosphate diphosphorylase